MFDTQIPLQTQAPILDSSTEKTRNPPTWPEPSKEHPLTLLLAKLPSTISEADYDEVYGINLHDASPFYVNLILQKFLRANANNILKAQAQLLDTLKWRKTFQPLKAKDEVFSSNRFGGLGYVINLDGVPQSPNKKDVVTFNIYGRVKDNKSTFSDLDGFMRWRVGLMELSIAELELSQATIPIPDYNQGPDHLQGIQVW